MLPVESRVWSRGNVTGRAKFAVQPSAVRERWYAPKNRDRTADRDRLSFARLLHNARAKPLSKRCYSPCQRIDPIGDCELVTFATIAGEAPVRRDSFG